ncbi:MAG: hypothetical protein WCV85_01795 [Patescibacteria group bacterium]
MLKKEFLSQQEMEFIYENIRIAWELKEKGLFVPINQKRMHELVGRGIAVPVCPDGDHSHDMFNHLTSFTRRVHAPALNGGAVMMSPHHPKYQIEGQALFNSLDGARQAGKRYGNEYGLFGFETHLVCKAMLEEMRGIASCTQCILEGKDDFITRTGISPKATMVFIRIDWTPFEQREEKKKRRTYIVKGSRRELLRPYLQ